MKHYKDIKTIANRYGDTGNFFLLFCLPHKYTLLMRLEKLPLFDNEFEIAILHHLTISLAGIPLELNVDSSGTEKIDKLIQESLERKDYVLLFLSVYKKQHDDKRLQASCSKENPALFKRRTFLLIKKMI